MVSTLAAANVFSNHLSFHQGTFLSAEQKTEDAIGSANS